MSNTSRQGALSSESPANDTNQQLNLRPLQVKLVLFGGFFFLPSCETLIFYSN
jgi:hypothetical protein